jgi:hypothetical protein
MQIEEIDRHHPSAFVGDRSSSIDNKSDPQDPFTSKPSTTGLVLDVSTLNISDEGDMSVSPVGEVPGPRVPMPERRFSAGNRAFEEQALAVSHPCRPNWTA